MSGVAMLTLALLFSLQRQQTARPQPPANPPPSSKEGVLKKLYHLVWPVGQYKGSLADDANAATQKAGVSTGLTLLYIVNTREGTAQEWPSALGGREPVVCAGENLLFYRRGNVVYRESFKLQSAGVSSSSPPVEIAGVSARRLWACTQEAQGQPALWIETMNGELRLVRWDGSAASLSELPADATLKSINSDELGELLREFQSMRPDGFDVFVVGAQLVGQKSGGPRTRLVGGEYAFVGDPVWVGESEFVFVNALVGGSSP